MQFLRTADPRIQAALDFLDANPDEDLTVAQLTAASGLSPSRFSHLFALRTGTTPGQLLRRVRQLQAERRRASAILGIVQTKKLPGF